MIPCQGQFRCPERRVWPVLRSVQGPRRPQSVSVSFVRKFSFAFFQSFSLLIMRKIFRISTLIWSSLSPGLTASLAPTSVVVSATWCSPPRWANTRNWKRSSGKPAGRMYGTKEASFVRILEKSAVLINHSCQNKCSLYSSITWHQKTVLWNVIKLP